MWKAKVDLKVAHEMFRGLCQIYQVHVADTRGDVRCWVRDFLKDLKDQDYVIVVSEITYERVS